MSTYVYEKKGVEEGDIAHLVHRFSPIFSTKMRTHVSIARQTRHGMARQCYSGTRLSRLPVAVKVCLGVELYPRDQTPTIDGKEKKKKSCYYKLRYATERPVSLDRAVNHVRAFDTMLNQAYAHVNEIASYYCGDREKNMTTGLRMISTLIVNCFLETKFQNYSLFYFLYILYFIYYMR